MAEFVTVQIPLTQVQNEALRQHYDVEVREIKKAQDAFKKLWRDHMRACQVLWDLGYREEEDGTWKFYEEYTRKALVLPDEPWRPFTPRPYSP